MGIGGAQRGLSPVIGVVLLVAVALLLVTVTSYMIFGLTDETDPQPDVVIRLEPTEDSAHYKLHHVSGEQLSGNRTTLQGAANEDALHGRQLSASDEVEVVPVASEVRLVWRGEHTGHTIQTYDVNTSALPYNVDDLDAECPWVEQRMNSNSGDLNMAGDGAVCDVTEDTNVNQNDNDIDVDSNSVLVGNIDVDGDVDVDSSMIVGSVTTNGNDIVITEESEIYGDVVAQPGTNIDIDGNSSVSGAVVVDGGSLSLDSVEIDDHVYAEPSDVSGCSNAILGPNGESCSEYTFRDPSSY